MYTLTRQEVADNLWISIRSVDRYIKSWKLRAKKNWKIIYVNSEDTKLLQSDWKQEHEVIIPTKNNEIIDEESTDIAKIENNNWMLDIIYSDLKEEIKRKDELIQALSVSIGRAEEIAKSSISLADFKKSQYLLEESKFYLSNELDTLKKDKKHLEEKLRYEKTSNIILIVFTVALLFISAFIWFNSIA